MEQLSKNARIRNRINDLFPIREDMTESDLLERAENINKNWDSIMSEFYTSEELEKSRTVSFGETARKKEKFLSHSLQEKERNYNTLLFKEKCTGDNSVPQTEPICNSTETNPQLQKDPICKGIVEKPNKQDIQEQDLVIKQVLVPDAIHTDAEGNKLEIQYEAETGSRFVVYPDGRREILVEMNREDPRSPRDMYKPVEIAAPWLDTRKIKGAIPQGLLDCRDRGAVPENMIRIFLQFFPGDKKCFREFDKFCSWNDSSGKKRVKWNSTWRNWLIKVIEFSEAKR